MLFTLIACAAAPKKNFTVNKWLPVYGSCFERLTKEGEILRVCIDDDDDMIGISLRDYQKELNYQDLLKNKCKAWKK